MPVSHFRSVMEVNFFSIITITKRALPLLKRQVKHEKGRAAAVRNVTPSFPHPHTERDT